jgi:hypothetical protein
MEKLERERDEARQETIRTREFMDHGFAKAQEELAAVTEQRDGLRSGIDYASDQLSAVTKALQSPIEVELDMIRGKIAIPDRPEFAYIEQLTAVTAQRDRLIKAVEPLEYWRDISECDCSSPLPQGGCLRCDLNRVLKIANPNA